MDRRDAHRQCLANLKPDVPLIGTIAHAPRHVRAVALGAAWTRPVAVGAASWGGPLGDPLGGAPRSPFRDCHRAAVTEVAGRQFAPVV